MVSVETDKTRARFDTPDARWRIDFVDDGKRRHLATRLTSPTGTSLLWVVFLFRTSPQACSEGGLLT